MPVVNLPDGSRVNFPDGTSPDDMNAAIEQHMSANLASQIKLPGADLTASKQRGSLLPINVDQGGDVHFDPDAGFIGAAKNYAKDVYQALRYSGDVVTGKAPPDDPKKLMDLALAISPVSPALRAGEKIVPGVAKNFVKDKPPVPTADELRQAARGQYDAVNTSPVQYRTDAVNQMAATAQQSMERDGFRAEQTPNTFSILKDLQQNPGGSFASPADLESARKALNKAAANFQNPTEQEAARRAIQHLDEFTSAADPQSLMAGTAPSEGARVAQNLQDARGNYAAASRSDRVTDAKERGELNAAVANSGRNTDNAVRQQLRSLLTSDAKSRGFSEDELDAIVAGAKGSKLANALRTMGNAMGGGLGWGGVATGGIGTTIGTQFGLEPQTALALGMAVPATGMAAKKYADALTLKGVDEAARFARERSPLYQKNTDSAPYVAGPVNAKAAALAKALAIMQSPDFKEMGGI